MVRCVLPMPAVTASQMSLNRHVSVRLRLMIPVAIQQSTGLILRMMKGCTDLDSISLTSGTIKARMRNCTSIILKSVFRLLSLRPGMVFFGTHILRAGSVILSHTCSLTDCSNYMIRTVIPAVLQVHTPAECSAVHK